MKIAFLGTPSFSLPSLQLLINRQSDLAVFTQPDRPVGRKAILTPPPVKELALKYDIPVYQFERIRSQEGLQALESFHPDLMITVAFGQLLSSANLAIPRYGTINVHGSLLPKYRGAAPMQYSVLNGDETAGVTIMYVCEALDSGDIILKKEIQVGEDETFGELHDRLSVLGAEALVEAMREIEAGTSTRTPQNSEEATFAPSIKKEECIIDWSLPSAQVHNRVRGLSPIPCANTRLPDGKLLKIYRTEKVEGYSGQPGEIVDVIKKKGFVVACGEGAVCVVSAKPEGKREMPGFELVNGHYVKIGDVFSAGNSC
ncbi:MAG TPA: methionyl-tRNA formyltransferase [Methanocorpusculum sp.]|nr:methionyl-tRNA formyltransferase [Methanocorpusculum sp.]